MNETEMKQFSENIKNYVNDREQKIQMIDRVDLWFKMALLEAGGKLDYATCNDKLEKLLKENYTIAIGGGKIELNKIENRGFLTRLDESEIKELKKIGAN